MRTERQTWTSQRIRKVYLTSLECEYTAWTRRRNRKEDVPVVIINKHEVPSPIAWQLGNGEAEREKIRAYGNMFHINLLIKITEPKTSPKAVGLQRFELFVS